MKCKSGLPTPEELGEKVEKGEMTEAEAVEIMAERARRQALPFLYPPEESEVGGSDDPGDGGVATKSKNRLKTVLWLVLCGVALCIVMWFL